MRYLLLILSLSIGLEAQKIEFRDLSFKEGLEAAKKEAKPVFIDAYTTWCGPCKWMSANIFTDARVADYYNENYICLKIDMEKGEGLEIAKKYQVRAYPTLLYLDEGGERLLVSVGANRDPQTYIDAGEQAKNPKRNLPYLLNNVEANFEDATFMRDYFRTVSAANMLPSGMVDRYFEQFRIEDWTSEENWEIVQYTINDINSKSFRTLLKNAELVQELRPEDGLAFIQETLFYGLANRLYRARSEEAMTEYEALRSEYLNEDYPFSGKISFQLDLIEHKKNEDFEAYGKAAMSKVEKYLWDDANELNNISWTIYEELKNPDALKAALSWAERAVELSPEHHILDTYAHLLAVNKQVDKAVRIELHALEKAQEEGADTKAYRDYIEELQR